jgi:putative oxidoreductase
MNTATRTIRPGSDTSATADFAYPSRDVAALVGRVLLASLFVPSGFSKLVGFAGTVGYIASQGLPFPTVLAAIAVAIELGAGLALLIGWRARWAAAFLALFLVVITPIFHNFWGVPEAQAAAQKINFMKNIAILGGMLVVFAFGPGRFSFDRK